MRDLVTASAAEIASARNLGSVASAEILDPFRARFAAYESQVLALVDRKYIDAPRSHEATGPLAGVPIVLKDIIDTADTPTQYGSSIYLGHQPAADAALVARLRSAGSTIVGKGVTAEFGIRTPRETTNPHDFSRTPGGSSSGSAAAVAAGFAVLSVGTQTTASTIRPASYCGVFGLKPTHDAVSTDGIYLHSHTMDTVGLFARHADDLAVMLSVLASDRAAAAMRMQSARKRLPDARLRIGLLRVPDWSRLESQSFDAMERGIAALQEAFDIVEIEHPAILEDAWGVQPVVHHTETSINLGTEYQNKKELLSPQLVEIIERGAIKLDSEYWAALETLESARAATVQLFRNVDYLVLPCAAGVAPVGLDASGGAEFGRVASATGLPCLAVPGVRIDGLPFGMQIIGPHYSDLGLISLASRVAALVGYEASRYPAMTPGLV